MVTKLIKRKHSIVVVEAFLAASEPLADLSQAELERAVADFEHRKAVEDRQPEHIKVIKRLGIAGAVRGYSDADIAAFIEARDQARRELERPEDFVSGPAFSAAQASNRKGEARAESDRYSHDEVRIEAEHMGWNQLPKGSHKRRPMLLKIAHRLHLLPSATTTTTTTTKENSVLKHLQRIIEGKVGRAAKK